MDCARDSFDCSRIVVWPSAAVGDDNIIWIAHGKLNLLFRYDCIEEKAEFICSLRDEPFIKELLVGEIICVAGGIITIPAWGNHVHYFDTSNEIDDILPIPEETQYRDKMLFCGAYSFGNRIICVPANYRYILGIDKESKCVEVLFDIRLYFKSMGIDNAFINDYSCDDNGVLFATIIGTNKIFTFDPSTKTPGIIEIGENDCKYCSVLVNMDRLIVNDNSKAECYEFNKKDLKMIRRIPVKMGEFILLMLSEDMMLLDSFRNAKYCIASKDGVFEFDSPDPASKPDYFYNYHHGLIINGLIGNRKYYDRHSYEMCDIDANANIIRPGKRIVANVEHEKIRVPLGTVLNENSTFGLGWLLKNM